MRITGLVIVLVFVLVLLLRRNESAEGPEGSEGASLSKNQIQNQEDDKEGGSQIRLISGNPLIEEFGEDGGSVLGDLEALRDVVRDCQLLIKDFDRFHLPGNPEIVKFLQGENPENLAWVPVGFPFVNKKGELVDRDGIPVVFHRLSGMKFEYRSAGPDGEHWTADDVTVR